MKAFTTPRFQLILLLILLPILLSAQGKEANNWYMGSHAGITFNGQNPPQPLYNGQTELWDTYFSGVASISDENGNLLFYGDGHTIWNSDHEIMLNGENIGAGSCQGALIVQDPGNSKLYYYFSFMLSGQLDKRHFQYLVVDMNLDNGKGGVIPDKKNIKLFDYTDTHLNGVKHANGEDVWVVIHDQGNDAYVSYQVTASGIMPPVISYAGRSTYDLGVHGYLKISPNGKKIAISATANYDTSFCELLDFDTETGIISDENIVCFPNNSNNYGLFLEFSPDNSLLYIKDWNIFLQYDLKAGTPDEIINSGIQITTEPSSFNGALQLGPDGKIYTPGEQQYIGVIHNPNVRGVSCDFEKEFLFVGDNRYLTWNLPTFIQSYLNDPEFSTSPNCSGQPTQFNIANTHGIDSVKWKFWDWGNYPNDTSTLFSPQYTFSAPGTYYPELTVWSGYMERKIRDTVIIYEVPTPNFGPDTLFCPDEAIDLILNAGPVGQYYWNGSLSPGDSTFIVTDTGTYRVRVNNHGCIGRDTINVERYDAATAAGEVITPSTCGMSNGAITGIVITATDLAAVSWLDAWDNPVGNGNDLIDQPAGSYFALVTFGSGCTQRFGPYFIADENAPSIANALPEEDHCYKGVGSITVIPETGSVTDYLYSINGTDYFPLTTGEITGLPADVYNITLKDQFGCISEVFTVEVDNVPGPVINCFSTPASGTSANGTITVISPNDNLTYQLEGGLPQLSNVFTHLAAGEYYVIVTDAYDCQTRDTIVVDLHQGTFLAALAKDDRKCLYKPANSDLRITAVSKLTDLKATLYFNDNILKCTNFNANEAIFPGITAQLFTTPARIELSWHGIDPVTSTDTLLIGTMIFETIQYGIANVEWDTLSSVTYFLNQYGESIFPYFQPGIINVHELPQIDIDNKLEVCEKGSITLLPQVTGGAHPVAYTWITPKGTTIGTELELTNAAIEDSGNYLFVASDYLECTDTAEIRLNVISLPDANFPAINPTNDTILYEQSYLLEATKGYASYEWNTGDTTYYINVSEEGEYSVIMETKEGCQAVESVFMLETFFPIYVPNAFTPNQDGLNDTFKPVVNTEMVRSFSMSIYNRWGQRIFETNNPTRGWDGENAGPGVYNWMISYSNMLGKVYGMKGMVTVIK